MFLGFYISQGANYQGSGMTKLVFAMPLWGLLNGDVNLPSVISGQRVWDAISQLLWAVLNNAFFSEHALKFYV